jgi:uncharacterized protein YecA (UPF0149 family)
MLSLLIALAAAFHWPWDHHKKPPASEWSLILEGASEGFGVTHPVETIELCMADVKTDLTDLTKAVKLLEKKDAKDVMEGLWQLAKALHLLPSTIRTCKAAEQDLKRIGQSLEVAIQVLENPKEFAFHVDHDLEVNGKDIYAEMKAAVTDYEAKNWESFGKNVGEALEKLLVGEAEIVEMVTPPLDPTVWAEISMGVAQGFGLRGTEQELQGCFEASESDSLFIHEAIQLLEQKDAKDVIDGLADIGKALESLPLVISTCEAAADELKEDGKKLEKALEVLKHPLEFAYHVGKDLMLNGKDIFHEVTAAQSDYKAQLWRSFGQDVGAALEKLLVGDKPSVELVAVQIDPTFWMEVVKGVGESFGFSGTEEELKECFSDVETDVSDLDDALHLIEKEDAKDVLDGLADLGKALETLPQAIATCKAGAEDLKENGKKLEKALTLLEHPKEFVYHVGKELMLNGKDIFREVFAAKSDYDAKSYEAFGKDVGEVLAKLLLTDEPSVELVSLSKPADPTYWMDVVKGVGEGFGFGATEQAVKECLSDLLWKECYPIDNAINRIERKDTKDVIDGLADLGKALEEVPSMIAACKDAEEDLKEDGEKLMKALLMLQHPEAFAYHVGKDLLVNGKDIFDEVEAAQSDYKAQKWEAFGKDVGEVLEKLLLGQAASALIV